MAATLSLLRLPILPQKPTQCLSKIQQSSSIPTAMPRTQQNSSQPPPTALSQLLSHSQLSHCLFLLDAKNALAAGGEFGGGLNTWFRTRKLFLGPHLFDGAAITVLWASAASLTPAMQKGSETARSLHIALNTINVLLFVWQIPTGWEILLKVFEFTKWP